MLRDEDERLLCVGLNVNRYRKRAKLSVETLATKAGLSVSTIEKLEGPTSPKNITLKNLFKISDALEIDIAKLFMFD